MRTISVAVSAIRAGANDRSLFDPDALETLASSIRQNGLAQPPTLRPMPDGMYEIVAGERRVRAMSDVLGWAEIPAIVRPLDDEAASAIMLSENTARADLNPIEEAQAYRKRLDAGWTMERLAEVSGKRVRAIEQHLLLLSLPLDIQHYVATRALPMNYGILLDGLDANRQRIAARVYNQTPGMTLIRWRDVLQRLGEEQTLDNQTALFDLDAWSVPAVLTAPSKGRSAVTGVPAGTAVPPVRHAAREGMAAVMERYVLDLEAAGHLTAAQAVGNLYNVFVAMSAVVVTSNLQLPARHPEVGTVGDNLHDVVL